MGNNGRPSIPHFLLERNNSEFDSGKPTSRTCSIFVMSSLMTLPTHINLIFQPLFSVFNWSKKMKFISDHLDSDLFTFDSEPTELCRSLPSFLGCLTEREHFTADISYKTRHRMTEWMTFYQSEWMSCSSPWLEVENPLLLCSTFRIVICKKQLPGATSTHAVATVVQ